MPTDVDTTQAVLDGDKPAPANDDAALLVEIRSRFKYAKDQWEDIRKEAEIDRRYVLGDPWDPKDRQMRDDAGRPCINHDELSQYINQYVNGLRQAPPGIVYSPGDEGTDDKTAQLMQDHTRSIEYQSDAQGAYVGAAEDAAESSYGAFRVTREYVSDDSFDQRIVIKAILNPDSVVYDPDCKKPDWSDARYCFVLDPIPREDFVRRYPKAEKTSFSGEDMKVASDWVTDKQVLTAEYWRVEEKQAVLQMGGKKRTVTKRTIVQYITNGVEILSRSEQPGTIIPIIMVIGKEMYVDDGAGAKRHLISLVRLARDPQMSLAYMNSLEMEEAGLTPKVPYVGYKGQFESDAETWEELTKVPHAYAMADVVLDGANNPLPLPVRQQFTPNFAAYEVAKDSCRRAIQAAMGIMPLPTAAQRDSEKSGIALQRIQQQQSVGSFHFTANLHRAMRLCGKIIDEWSPIVYDTERDLTLTADDGKRRKVKINTAQPYAGENGEQEHYKFPTGNHDITISVGPSEISTRQAAQEFLNLLVQNLGQLPPPGTPQAKVLAMAIRMQQLGPRGDALADIFDPPEGQNIPPQAQAAIAQAQQQVQLITAELQKLQQEKQGKVVENQFRLEIEKAKQDAETIREGQRQQFELAKANIDKEIKVAIAEIETKAQVESERRAFVGDVWKQTNSQAHEAGIQAQEHAHEVDMQQAEQAHQQDLADQAAQNAQQQQATQIQAEQQAQAQQPSGTGQ